VRRTPKRICCVADIGINHNGDIDTAAWLIARCAVAGFDVVKFQKRTINMVYTREQLRAPRVSPFGTTNGQQKYGLEFSRDEYEQVDHVAKANHIAWTASVWDTRSVEFLAEFNPPYIKIPSACAADRDVLDAATSTEIPLQLSTGMLDLPSIVRIVDYITATGGTIDCVMHCVSTYPCPIEDLNLNAITTLQRALPGVTIGYSGHEVGVSTTLMAVVLGAEVIERHVTKSRAMYGSDQAASLEPLAFDRVVRDVRTWEKARGSGDIVVTDGEQLVADKLRRSKDF